MSKLIFQKNLLRKFWWAGRMGTTNYILILLVLLNFILITYNFLIEGNTIFEKFTSTMWLFAIVFLIFYVPVSVLIGRWHTNTQISTEQIIRLSEDPILAKMIRTLLDAKTGKISEGEITEFRKEMEDIEKQNID